MAIGTNDFVMKVPEKVESVSIWIHTDIKGKEKIDPIFVGLRSAVNRKFEEQGYDVSDAFKIGSNNNYNGRFCIIVSLKIENEDSCIILDDELAKRNTKPTLELLTIEMIRAIKNREHLNQAYVYHSDIPGLDFLDRYIVEADEKVYVLKGGKIKGL